MIRLRIGVPPEFKLEKFPASQLVSLLPPVYCKVVNEFIIPESMGDVRVMGGYEPKLRDVREERERREMRSVDFYLVTPVSLVLLVLPHRPC